MDNPLADSALTERTFASGWERAGNPCLESVVSLKPSLPQAEEVILSKNALNALMVLPASVAVMRDSL